MEEDIEKRTTMNDVDEEQREHKNKNDGTCEWENALNGRWLIKNKKMRQHKAWKHSAEELNVDVKYPIKWIRNILSLSIFMDFPTKIEKIKTIELKCYPNGKLWLFWQ